MRAKLLLLLACLLGVVAPEPVASRPARKSESERVIHECLIQVALGRKRMPVCNGLASRRCVDEISRAGGDLGTRTISMCATREVSAWFEAWAFALEEAWWNAPDDAAILDRFAGVQAETAQKCFRHADSIIMIDMAECVGNAYGPFLAKEMRSHWRR